MKKSLLCRIAAAGAALFLSTIAIFPSFAAEQGIGPGFEEEVEDTSKRPKSPLDMNRQEEASVKASVNETETNDEAGSDADTKKAAETAVETGTPGESYGIFCISGYCGCKICSGGHNLTYSGVVPTSSHTISADLDRFPLGTKLLIDGTVYTVEDMGGGVTGDRLDIYFDTHQEALDYGLKKIEVFSVLEEN